jgi:hypothetical protein
MCKQLETTQKPIAELISCLSLEKSDYGMGDLETKAQCCPMCILSAIRQSKIRETYKEQHPEEYQEHGPLYIDWDYKKALAKAWQEVNSAAAEEEENEGATY